jgi:hypothetical protein
VTALAGTGRSGSSGSGGATLPYTGLPTWRLVGAALAMVAVGSGLVVLGAPRRRGLHWKGRA